MPSKTAEEYSTIKIPKELAALIDDVLEKKLLGYRTRAELVNTAIREYICKIMKKEEPNSLK